MISKLPSNSIKIPPPPSEQIFFNETPPPPPYKASEKA